MGSKIVRADMCSEVEGSKRMTFPCEFPVSSQHRARFDSFTFDAEITKRNIAVLHPGSDSNWLVGCKSCNLIPSK